MTPSELLQLLPGPFHFLRPDPEEIRRLVPDLGRTLPRPQRVFLDNEERSPLRGFPVLISEGLVRLRRALQRYVAAEEEAQCAIQARRPHDKRGYQQAWDGYRELLAMAVENVSLSSYGRQFPAIFWLHHSLDLARLLKETPRRVLRRDLELGRSHGDHIKYRVLDRYLDRVFDATYDTVNRMALDTEEAEEDLFPRILTRMRDNVLVLTEDHISSDLAELSSYFAGHLRIDGRDLRRRLEATEAWHRERFRDDRDLQELARHLLEVEPATVDPRGLLVQRGYLSYLASRQAYDPRKLLTPEQVQIWESLLVKLKEFELIHSVRRFLLPAKRDGGRLLGRPRGVNRPGGEGQALEVLSPATRPMDFLAPWVVDPLVDRFGLIYDLTDFSQIVSVLRRSGSANQDRSFRQMFRFQRRINQLARGHRMQLEKYLGDGAFFSSRRSQPLLTAAVKIQRLYRQELDDDFPFDHGMRVAVNYGQYRIIPIGRGAPGEAARYEFFGHSLVELSRLTTGKARRDIEEIQNMLLTYGYPDQAVERFFEPLLRKNVDVVDRDEEARTFKAYINRNGSLVNEGIVTTEPFLHRLEREGTWSSLQLGVDGARSYVVIPLDPEEELSAGVRKLGMATLKGLEKVAVYEVVDAQDLEIAEDLPPGDLLPTLDRLTSGDGQLAVAAEGEPPRPSVPTAEPPLEAADLGEELPDPSSSDPFGEGL